MTARSRRWRRRPRRRGTVGRARLPAGRSARVRRRSPRWPVRRRGRPGNTLTPRERDVLRLMAEGRTNAAIAEHMVITEKSVSNHINTLFAKLGLPPSGSGHRRVLAVLAYLDQ
ncbi:response regulator transcription factor [Plantactinospora solaniradicis]|uniref:Response regulator transcription factor n=1 Tax=Plantactinospora solaniradicis TaxID=1723736 RepID=A0ABW1KPA4_9ACTN